MVVQGLGAIHSCRCPGGLLWLVEIPDSSEVQSRGREWRPCREGHKQMHHGDLRSPQKQTGKSDSPGAAAPFQSGLPWCATSPLPSPATQPAQSMGPFLPARGKARAGVNCEEHISPNR